MNGIGKGTQGVKYCSNSLQKFLAQYLGTTGQPCKHEKILSKS